MLAFKGKNKHKLESEGSVDAHHNDRVTLVQYN